MIPVNAVQIGGTGAVTADELNTFVQTDPNATLLRAWVGAPGMAVMLQGLAVAGDGGAGLFYWASGGSYTDDGGITTVVPSGQTTGAWLRGKSLFPIPNYTVAGLPAVTSADVGAQAFATNGRNTGQGAGTGTGCNVFVNNAGTWCAVWSGAAVTS